MAVNHCEAHRGHLQRLFEQGAAVHMPWHLAAFYKPAERALEGTHEWTNHAVSKVDILN